MFWKGDIKEDIYTGHHFFRQRIQIRVCTVTKHEEKLNLAPPTLALRHVNKHTMKYTL